MPRATRAALRAQELLDDATHDAAAIALPLTPNKERVVLGEISSNVNAGNEVSAPDVSDVTSKPPKSKSNKKAGKKARAQSMPWEKMVLSKCLRMIAAPPKARLPPKRAFFLLAKISLVSLPFK